MRLGRGCSVAYENLLRWLGEYENGLSLDLYEGRGWGVRVDTPTPRLVMFYGATPAEAEAWFARYYEERG